MNHNVRKGFVAAAFLATAIMAVGQERRDRDRDWDWYHSDRDARYRGEEWRQRLFWQVREDLEHVQNASFPFGRDQYRIQRTKQELNELQDKLSRGYYDQRELDEVIGAMQRVVSDNRLSPRDRDLLGDDLRRMREYRERHESWGR